MLRQGHPLPDGGTTGRDSTTNNIGLFFFASTEGAIILAIIMGSKRTVAAQGVTAFRQAPWGAFVNGQVRSG